MKRLDFLRSLLAASAAVIAIAKAPAAAPKTFWKKYHATKLTRMRRRLLGDIPLRSDAPCDPEIFTSIMNRPGEDRLLQFFGRGFNGKVSEPIDIEKK